MTAGGEAHINGTSMHSGLPVGVQPIVQCPSAERRRAVEQTTSVAFESATFLSSVSLSSASVHVAAAPLTKEPQRPHRFDPELVTLDPSLVNN